LESPEDLFHNISPKGNRKTQEKCPKNFMEICGVSHFESKFMPVLGLASNENFVDVVAMVV